MRSPEFEVMMIDQHQRPHGIKRHAESELELDQPLAKRFDLLNIDKRGGKLYVPVQATDNGLSSSKTLSKPPIHREESNLMEVEDTKHRVFIHDLDEELGGTESDEDNPIFLPDIEKHLLKIPKAVLMNDEEKQKLENMQMVLYNVPSSLTLPKEEDTVRRAIIESRKRIQDRQPFTIPTASQKHHTEPSTMSHHTDSWIDEDAMDIE